MLSLSTCTWSCINVELNLVFIMKKSSEKNLKRCKTYQRFGNSEHLGSVSYRLVILGFTLLRICKHATDSKIACVLLSNLYLDPVEPCNCFQELFVLMYNI